MCPQLPLVGVHAHARALGRRWCDKPDKNLEKNSDPPIINPIIREKKSSLILPLKLSVLNVPKIAYSWCAFSYMSQRKPLV